MNANVLRIPIEHAGEVAAPLAHPALLSVPIPITVGRVVLAPSPSDPSTFNPQPPTKSSLTAAVMALAASADPFIGTHEMFHVELMGGMAGHFTRLGRALERERKSRADRAHILALAEEITRLAHLDCIEGRCDEAGVVRPGN